ncbi:MAG: ATP-dependent metallopeptidase FtsH/Yme1/Tma family protein, partial [Planctomycetaceae bacterium]
MTKHLAESDPSGGDPDGGNDRSRPPGLGDQRGSSEKNGPPRRSAAPWVLLLLMLGMLALWSWQRSPSNHGPTISYSQFRAELARKNLESVRFHGEIVTGEFLKAPEPIEASDGSTTVASDLRFNMVLPSVGMRDAALLERLEAQGVDVHADRTSVGLGTQMAIWLLIPLVFIL